MERTFRKEESRIFENINFLLKGYNPMTFADILHRDEQIKQYMGLLSRAMNGHTPDNIFVYGKTGVGKTIITKGVTAQLEQDAGKAGVNIKTAYINCEAVHTDTGIIKLITAKIAPNYALRKTINSFDAYFNIFCEAINSFEGIPIIILDEVDKLNNTDILNTIARVKENGLIDKNLSIIGITNDLKFADELDPRTKSALSKSSLIFPPYNANQIRDILTQRAKVAFKDNTIDETVIPLCAAYAAQEHGDARRAIDLLRISGEVAERSGEAIVTEHHVKKAKDQIETDEIKETIKSLPTQPKLVLLSCSTGNKDPLTTGEIYNMYKDYARVAGIEILTQRRVTDIINELDMLGIITAEIINKGRYGRTKEVSARNEKTFIINTLAEDERLKPLIRTSTNNPQKTLDGQRETDKS